MKSSIGILIKSWFRRFFNCYTWCSIKTHDEFFLF